MAARESFASRRTAVMAMAGSAIGRGNIWRFPYITGEYGGSAFIIVYLFACLLLSLPIMLSEMIIGRRAHSGNFGAFASLAPGTGWKYLSLITIVTPLIIVSYYSVVGGWGIDYLCKSLSLQFVRSDPHSAASLFGSFVSNPYLPLIFHTVFISLTALIVAAGVKAGIERFSKISIPILFVLIVVIMVYSLSLPGAKAGADYLLRPDFSKLTVGAVASAVGQSFFSLSLGVGTMLTYASYIRSDENIFTTALGTAFFDLLFALIAGFAVMGAVFAAGIEPGTGPGLVFETLPYVFSQMSSSSPWVGVIVSVLFFLTVLVAALTSSISMLEVGVAYLVEEKGFTRKKAVLVLFFGTWVLGCLCSLSFGPLSSVRIFGDSIFEACDKLASNYLMTFGGLLFSLFVGWKLSKAVVKDEFTAGGTQKVNAKCFPFVYFLIRYFAPIGVAAIFLTSIFL